MSRTLLFGIFSLFLPMNARLDELVLKDGTKIEWTALKDQGDSYDVETAQGLKKIRKADIAKIVPIEIVTPLAGAFLEFDKGRKMETINLFQALDAKRAIGGTWRGVPGALLATGEASMARLEIPVSLGPEYDLHVTVERREGSGEIGIGLFGGGRRFLFAVDSFACVWSGFAWIDGKSCNINGHALKGKLLEPKAPRTFVFQVRPDGVAVHLDGKPFIGYRGGWDRVSLDSAYEVKGADTPFLAVYSGTYAFTNLKLVRPKV